jgi:hypothetical protein
VALKAIQEQQEIIETLIKEKENLKREIEIIKKREN